MKKSKIDRCVSAVVISVCLIKAVLYGGSKPPSAPTNTPHCTAAVLSGRRGNGVGLPAPAAESGGGTVLTAAPAMLNLHCTTTTSDYTSVSNWTARGAYCDWQRIGFPDAFQFPVGTNLIDGVTLFAYGEIRENLRSTPTPSIYTLPAALAIEPNVSSVTHGLTPSNSYLFAWHDCCVERSATNRVNASIELFRSGEVVTCFGDEVGRVAPRPPEGWIGIGQDEDWIRANFPDEADYILSIGYADWLAEWVGENEMNGRYQCAVTVPALPSDGSPCYLVCGPYRVNVTAPGTYRFPLEVLTTYETRTYPTAVPLAFEYDDGYTGEGQSFHILDGQNPTNEPPRRMMLSAPMHIPYDYWKTLCPDIVVTPGRVPFESASGARLRFWCNVRDFVLTAIEGAAWLTWYEITHSEIALDRVDQAGWYYACAHERDWLLTGDFIVDPPVEQEEETVVTNRIDAQVFSGETIHAEIVPTNRLVTHVTAVSGANSTASLSVRLAEGQSAYVVVYMASSEPDGTPPYDDTVSWSVTSNGGGGLSGSTSVFAQSEGLAHGMDLVNFMYGMWFDPVVLDKGRLDAPAEGALRLQITATASDAIDDKRETCVQVVVYPIDANGNVIGLPAWVGE